MIDLDATRALATEARDAAHVDGASPWGRLDKATAALLLACDEIEALRAGLSEACDEFADAIEYLTPYHRAKWGYDATLVRLRALLPSDDAARATIAPMIPTLTEHTAAAHRALRPFGTRPWNDLSAEEQTELKSRVRACLDYVAVSHGERDGNGTIYALGPSDPPPQVPPT